MSVLVSSMSLLAVKKDTEMGVPLKVINIQESNCEGQNHKPFYSQATKSVDFYVSV